MVIGEQGAGGAWLLGGLVVPDRGGEGEESLQDAGGDAGGGDHVQADVALVGFRAGEGEGDGQARWGCYDPMGLL